VTRWAIAETSTLSKRAAAPNALARLERRWWAGHTLASGERGQVAMAVVWRVESNMFALGTPIEACD
jgi:hypothetical protein